MQLATFGRRLDGERDELPGFEQTLVKINDPAVAAKLGRTHHANASVTGNETCRIPGMVFEVTDAELRDVDAYEAADEYTRIRATLASGKQAWVYVYSPAG
ncbi:MAG: UDP-N-acetylmuramate--alanine ligase [Geminicoccaceae bacterium]|nr:UDP-N-acetylmuramate--alanine ligase [Geminicoccaceae bacterium]